MRQFWVDLIAHLIGGLLYGREVQRPAWLASARKVQYKPHPNARPPLRRMAVQERLLKGWTYQQIAADMGITPATVDCHAKHIYKEHRVTGRWELARQLGVKLLTKRDQVGERLAQGQSYKQIAREMGISYKNVIALAGEFRRKATSPPASAETSPVATSND